MKYSVLKLIYMVAYHIGLFQLFYFFKRKHQIVITYHNVISDDIYDGNLSHLGVSCSESAFVQQLNIILRRFKVTTEIGIPGSCMISFDDGYKNNIEIAIPFLNAKNVFGLFFVPACYFEHQTILWVDQLLMWVSYVPAGSYCILENTFVITKDAQSRQALWRYLYEKILSDYSLLEILTKELNHHYSFNDVTKLITKKMYQLRFMAMTDEDLNRIKKMGHKLGCHSFKHDILSLLTDVQLEYDFSMCALYSEKYNTTVYSYPFGGKNEVSDKVITQCKKYGYSAAFLNDDIDNQDHFSLGRISLDNLKDKYFIEARLSGFEKYLKKFLKKFHGFKILNMFAKENLEWK